MADNYTLIYGTYTFSNQTFEIVGHKQQFDTPVEDIRRKDGGVSLDAYEQPRKIRINGIIYGTNKDSVHNDLNTLARAVRNDGDSAQFKYRSDRFVTARISREGLNTSFRKGLYEYMYDVNVVLVAENPYAESTTLRTVSGSLNDGVTTDVLTNNGSRPTRPLFTFVAGASFTNDLRVDVPANSHFFSFSGPLLNGQSLIIDCDLGCVLLQSGPTFINAISHFGGNLFLEIPEGGNQNIVINAATLNYNIDSRDWFGV